MNTTRTRKTKTPKAGDRCFIELRARNPRNPGVLGAVVKLIPARWAYDARGELVKITIPGDE